MDGLSFDVSNVHAPEPMPDGSKMAHLSGSDPVNLLRNQIALLGGCAWRQKATGYPTVLHSLALAAYYILHLIDVRTFFNLVFDSKLISPYYTDAHRDRRITGSVDGALLDSTTKVSLIEVL